MTPNPEVVWLNVTPPFLSWVLWNCSCVYIFNIYIKDVTTRSVVSPYKFLIFHPFLYVSGRFCTRNMKSSNFTIL